MIRVRELWALPLDGPGGCEPSPTVLCLANGRFRVEAAWRDFEGRTGVGRAAGLTADTGYFWFFDDDNVELVLKVLDGSEELLGAPPKAAPTVFPSRSALQSPPAKSAKD